MSDLSDILDHSPLLVVGCGKMGGALLGGWLNQGLAPELVHIVDPLVCELAPVGAKQAVKYVCLDEVASSLEPRVILIAVKPQMMDAVLPGLGRLVGPKTLVLSIAAGTRIDQIQAGAGGCARVIRAMPNTPSAIGKGVAVLIAGSDCPSEDRQLAASLLEISGEVHWIEEEALLDAVTGLSGSGPAYFFLLVEAMTAGGVAAGLDQNLAAVLARRTAVGAGALLEASGESAEQLRQNVTSPKGTTEAGLEVLMQDGILEKLMCEAIMAATRRGRQLSDS